MRLREDGVAGRSDTGAAGAYNTRRMTETLVPNLRAVEAVGPPLRGQVG